MSLSLALFLLLPLPPPVSGQRWDWPDGSAHHHGDSDVSNGVQSACVSIGHRENHEGPAGYDDPDPCESSFTRSPISYGAVRGVGWFFFWMLNTFYTYT